MPTLSRSPRLRGAPRNCLSSSPSSGACAPARSSSATRHVAEPPASAPSGEPAATASMDRHDQGKQQDPHVRHSSVSSGADPCPSRPPRRGRCGQGKACSTEFATAGAKHDRWLASDTSEGLDFEPVELTIHRVTLAAWDALLSSTSTPAGVLRKELLHFRKA